MSSVHESFAKIFALTREHCKKWELCFQTRRMRWREMGEITWLGCGGGMESDGWESVFKQQISGLILICLRSDKWMCVRMLMQDYQITASINSELLKTDGLSCRNIFNKNICFHIHVIKIQIIFRQACVNSSWGENKILPRIEKLFMHGFTVLMLNPFPPSRLLSWLSCLNQLYLMLGFTFPEILPKT